MPNLDRLQITLTPNTGEKLQTLCDRMSLPKRYVVSLLICDAFNGTTTLTRTASLLSEANSLLSDDE